MKHKGHYNKNNKCKDCDKTITNTSIRCASCAHKKHGQYCKNYKNYCINCGKELTGHNRFSLRCISCSMIGKHHWNFGKKSPEASKRMKGKNNPMYGKLRKPNMCKYKKIWMRSSWEILFAQFLDLSNIKWQYEPKVFDLGNSTYTPDFYLPEWNLYVEIKAWLNDDFNKKLNKFKLLYSNINIKVLMKSELEILGVL